jgi:hypothetical protein
MSVPLRITGPAIIQFGGLSYYFQDGLKGSIKRNTVGITVDDFGEVAKVAKNFVVEFSGKPVGAIDIDLINAVFLPYSRNDHGKSIFGSTDVPLVIWARHPFDGTDLNKITWKRGAIKKSPTGLLSATRGQLYSGEMTFSCLMASDFNMVAAAAWYSAVNAAFTDTTFDPNTVRMARYTAALGSRAAPYDAILAQEGFTIENTFGTKDIDVDNFGIIDQVVDADNFAATAKFKPANLKASEIDALIRLQDTTALLPGDVIGGAGEDLVITSDLLIATLKNCDATDTERLYKTGVLQPGETMFINASTFTSGVADPAWAFSIPV